MKPLIITCLLLTITSPASFGATDCKIQEYQDRSELTCIGDEKTKPESSVPATPSAAKPVATVAENREAPREQQPESAPAAITTRKTPLPSGTAAQHSEAAATTSTKAAEELAKRRELATRNTRNLKGYTSATTPPSR